MTEDNILYRLEQAEKHIEDTEKQIIGLRKKFDSREQERQEQETKNLKYGIMFLGSLVSTLLAILWTYRSVIFR